MRPRWRFACFSLLLVSSTLYAQKDTSSISGTIHDSSGAVVPNAQITIRNIATNAEQKIRSDALGEYVVAALHPGRYSIKTNAVGFAQSLVEPVPLDVDQRLRVDISLRLGTSEQRVTVSDIPPPLNTEDMTVGQVIRTTQIEDMPLNGRNFQQLAALVPGAIPSYGARDSGQGGVSLSGTRSFDNSFLLDGVNNSTHTAEMPTRVNLTVSPNLDAIQEFKIQSSTYDAQYGNTAGGTINIITKSGTNEFRGTGYDYLRNSALNANSWENNRGDIPKGHRERNQFGGVLGGPVWIPGLYNGKNKTFFFFDYEGVRDILPPGFMNVIVPDAKMRGGDFSELLPGAAANPSRSSFVLGAPYVNNVLPQSLLDPVAKNLAALYPLPNVPGTLNYQTSIINTFDSDNLGVRVDQRISDHDQVFGRFSQNSLTQQTGTWSELLGPMNQNKTDGSVFVVSETHTFSPSVVNELRFGYSHARPYRLPLAPDRDLYSEFSLTGVPPQPGMPTGLLRFNGDPGIQAIGRRSGYYNDTGIVKDYSDNVSWFKGRQSFRAGVSIRPIRFSHALLTKLEKLFSNGMSFLASYTYGHALDNASDANLGSAHAGDTFRDPRHLNWEYGNSDFDIRNRFVFSAIYDLPFGKGRQFGSDAGRLLNALVGGWQASGIWTIQSGYWFTPFGVNDSCFCNDGNANSLRPDVVKGQDSNGGPKTVDEWFNLNAFDVNVPAGRHGDAGRNTILGPGFDNVDFGLHKEFPIHEQVRLQFRGEFFNIFNHPNFAPPDTNYGDDTVGQILSTLGTREIQLALKLIF